MCYRTEQKFSAKELVERTKKKFPEEEQFEARDEVNGFDHELSPIITSAEPDWIQLYHWGLLPHWAKDTKIQNNTLNAKIETIHEKPSFRSYVNNRCLVPVSGLYEWLHKGKVLEKNLIKVKDQPIFSLAGLWNICPHPLTGEPYKSFTCVTNDGFVAILKDEQAWMEKGELLINEETIWIPLVNPQLDLFSDIKE